MTTWEKQNKFNWLTEFLLRSITNWRSWKKIELSLEIKFKAKIFDYVKAPFQNIVLFVELA